MVPYPPPYYSVFQQCLLVGIPWLVLLIWTVCWFRPGRKINDWEPALWLLGNLMLIGGFLIVFVDPWSNFGGALWIDCLWVSLAIGPFGAAVLFIRLVAQPEADSVVAVLSLLGAGTVCWYYMSLNLVTTPAGHWSSQCRNNLKQIATAFHTIADETEDLQFPARITGDPPVSWRVRLLPYLNHQTLFDSYDPDQPWDSDKNLAVAAANPQIYSCPAAARRGEARNAQGAYYTAYAIPYGERTFYSPTGRRSLIGTQTSSTILLVEACGQQIIWTEPRDVSAEELSIGINLPGEEPYQSNGLISHLHPYPFGGHVLMLDGSAKTLQSKMDPETLRQLLDPNQSPKNW